MPRQKVLAVASGSVGVRYVHYYDIFVRHAFGNFRDVLREVCGVRFGEIWIHDEWIDMQK